MNVHDTLRRFYARLVTSTACVTDARIVDAFATTKREQFVGHGPWHIQVSGGYMAAGIDAAVVSSRR